MMDKLKKLHEATLLDTPVFTVVRKEFKDIDLMPVGLNCADWVMVVVLDKKNNTIVVKQTRWGCEGQTLEFPCGTVEPNEKPEMAARRELKEETSFDSTSAYIEEIACFNPNPAYFNNHMHIYLCIVEDVSQLIGGELQLDKDEDCVPMVRHLDNELMNELSTHAMGLAAVGALLRSGYLDA